MKNFYLFLNDEVFNHHWSENSYVFFSITYAIFWYYIKIIIIYMKFFTKNCNSNADKYISILGKGWSNSIRISL